MGRKVGGLFSGFFYEAMAGIIGTLVGVIALNPQICGLAELSPIKQSITLVIGIFSFILLCVTLWLVKLSANQEIG